MKISRQIHQQTTTEQRSATSTKPTTLSCPAANSANSTTAWTAATEQRQKDIGCFNCGRTDLLQNTCPDCPCCRKRKDDANHPGDVDNKCCVCLRAEHRARYCRTKANPNTGKYCVYCKIHGSHTYLECRKRLYYSQNNVRASEQNELCNYFLETIGTNM